MNTKLLFGLIAVIALILVFKNRSQILPLGNVTRETPLDSSLIVTPSALSGRPQIEISTSKGKFTVELRPDLAPKTVTNYLAKWNSEYCVGKTFHRVEDWVVQGCDPRGDGTGGQSNLPTETSSESFTAGSLGVARKSTPKEYSNDSQFFIVKKDSTFLNGEYTYFGKVVSGMSVISNLTIGDKILSSSVLTK